MTDKITLTLMMARAFHAANAPLLAALAGTRPPMGGGEVAELWDGLETDVRDTYIDMAADFVIMLQGEGLIPNDTEWGVEVKKGSTTDWEHATLQRESDQESAVDYFREMELDRPFENYVRLVSRGVTEWRQVIDDGS